MTRLIAGLAVAATCVLQAQTQPLAQLTTVPERTGYRETSRYDDVMAFLKVVDAASPRIHLTTFGYTMEGRALPLAVVGDVANASPEAVKASGRLRVYIQGNIHGGEVEGKESAQKLLRAIARGGYADWMKTMVLLVAPIYNADGNERIALTNRGSQHGPIGGMGRRPNAQDFDLNRDHMKQESPEARSMAALFNDYDPHVGIDLHTTNGTRHAYHLTYSPPLNPNTDAGIIGLLRGEWFPHITKQVKAKHGWEYFYYGNASGQPGSRRWQTFEHVPRFNNNYIGLRNRFALLSEAYSYLTFEDRIKATDYFLEEALGFAAGHADRIKQIVAAADAASIVGKTQSVRSRYHQGGELTILMGDVEEQRHPYTGQVMLLRQDVVTPEVMRDHSTFESAMDETAPAEYYIPGDLLQNAMQNARLLGSLADKLTAHGIRFTRLTEPKTVRAERFAITSNTQIEREFQGHRMRTLDGAWEAASDVSLTAGSLAVPVNQPLGRIVFYLLEPRSDDGWVTWNVLDQLLGADTKSYPIVRVR
ncbi:MAG TPA: M14 family metallopeptidase [Vicinamibacterales bacterium]|nr:M14 family metallopeptidase [Vicinamibacterales bacterium]